MYRIKLSDNEGIQLRKKRNSAPGYLRERINCILMNSEGVKPSDISDWIGRSYDTVLSWVRAYKNNGLAGLYKQTPPGRPATARKKFKELASHWMELPPSNFGYVEEVWTIKLFLQQYKKETGFEVSDDTAERALKDLGYSYKRPKKVLPENAPTKEEKMLSVFKVLEELEAIMQNDDVDIYVSDESHFSNEPYLIKGWHKTGTPFPPNDTKEKRELHCVWGVEYKNKRFYLAKCKKRK